MTDEFHFMTEPTIRLVKQQNIGNVLCGGGLLNERSFSIMTALDLGWSSCRKKERSCMMRIEKAAVLGAGTMGAQIAAHLANAGVPTLLLDIPPRELTAEEQAKGLTLESPQVRNRIARNGL
jgi:hypothetical protein